MDDVAQRLGSAEFPYRLRPHQLAAVRAAQRAEDPSRCHLVLPPGSGKTLIGAELARRAGEAALRDVGATFRDVDAMYAGVAMPTSPQAVLAAMRATRYGEEAVQVGEVRADPPGRVLLRTTIGTTRIVDLLMGEMLPRIC